MVHLGPAHPRPHLRRPPQPPPPRRPLDGPLAAAAQYHCLIPPAPSTAAAPPPIKWAAQLSHVREVTLRGVADLPYWTAQLAPHHLTPRSEGGRAHLLLVAASARFRGVPFRELSVSVLVHATDPASPQTDAAYLVGAFNSNRFFAWCERTLFHTPYTHADVRLDPTPPASIHLTTRNGPALAATMTPAPDAPRLPATRAPAGFHGPVHLPRRSPTAAARQFIASVHGDTETHPFLPTDTLTLHPSPAAGATADAIRCLLDSHFTPTHWELRPDANHAKSKTYARPLAGS